MEFEEMKELIVNTLGCEADIVTPKASLTEDLGADSLASVELIMAVEDASGVTIGEEKLEELKTVEDVMNYIKAQQA